MTKILNTKTASTLLILSILSLVALYVLQVGFITRERTLINSRNSNIFSLGEYNKSLEIKLSKANSLNNIDKHLSGDFTKPRYINYIKVSGSVVARSQ